MTATIKDDFMQRIATEEAWKSLSENFAWTEALLEKNCEKVDWKEVSGNRNIIWTIPMLQKFSKKLDWEILSDHIDENWFTETHLEEFKDKWDWSKIPEVRLDFCEELIDKYLAYWDWNALIGERNFSYLFRENKLGAIAFFEKYKDHIPMAKLQDSDLWMKIIEDRAGQLKSDILS